MKKAVLWLVLLLSVFSLNTPDAAFARSKRSTTSQKQSAGISAAAADKKVRVKGYTRKDGTVVQDYVRAAPGAKIEADTVTVILPQKAAEPVKARPAVLKQTTAAKPAAAGPEGIRRDKRGRIARSEKAKDDFKKTHPCPANGKGSGSCPGYVIDHIMPLKRGGLDEPSNMQWQTTEEGKAKDKVE